MNILEPQKQIENQSSWARARRDYPGFLAGGMEINEVAEEYRLEREDMLAAVGYAAKIVAGEEIHAYA